MNGTELLLFYSVMLNMLLALLFGWNRALVNELKERAK